MASDQVFDFIVIGAGSAGCVLANRLSADPAARVLLLEAGGSDFNFWIRMPIGYGKTFYHPELNWRYQTEPDAGIGGRPAYWPRGRVIGGSSSINAMVYVRGQPADFDAWAALGNPGWSAADVLAVYRRMEDNLEGADGGRGIGGPLTITNMAGSVHPLANNYLKAAEAAGIPFNPDYNGETQEGASIYQVTTRKGLRCSSADAYLHPVRRRANLEVRTHAHVTRLLVESGRVTGVECVTNGVKTTVRTRREVILSAGAVNSPQIMMLSGIGDAQKLSALGIPPVLHAPMVGRNLQDHLGFDYIYESTRPTLNDVLRPWWGRLAVGLQYVLTRKGPLSLSVNQAGGFVRSQPDRQRPNIQLYFSPLSYTRAIPGKRALMRTDLFSGFMLGISNCHPKSRGTIELSSADPFAPPVIRPNYLSDESDLDELVDGARILRRIAAMDPIATLIKREIVPGPATDSDADMAADIRTRSGSVFHACGTCSMGPETSNSVVDPRLRVHGIEGLRVVDASIFPLIPSGNINAPSIMVGERGADFILEDWHGA
ncbi:GMC family oxidoreductase N-terminal domain-containing protein [Rhizobium sp. TRM96647]|uniref:GMC family oxidoreductase n=1 Tax=unclassified Rhizobium TaxID=2613769 RepID=UPI0021E7E43D|nr:MULTISPECIES: GMC family oxidoreductase N-terminal domain-containing protein [unclassified Rhizobium]MCV3739252.1 GMC family oxidoreductase N-terminal domain-containing protein [Rhizobium sp. TRM96647]MCV3760870.1 GMC family oxidoreductase N-terminal domain-containing protein [Rhizobium sp. TRM96650]